MYITRYTPLRRSICTTKDRDALPHSNPGLRNFPSPHLKNFFCRVQLKNTDLSGAWTADRPFRSHWPNPLGYQGAHADFWFRAALIPDCAASTTHAVLYTILISQFLGRILPQTKLSNASEGCPRTEGSLRGQASEPGAAKQRLKDVRCDAWQNLWNWRNWRNGGSKRSGVPRVGCIWRGINIIYQETSGIWGNIDQLYFPIYPRFPGILYTYCSKRKLHIMKLVLGRSWTLPTCMSWLNQLHHGVSCQWKEKCDSWLAGWHWVLATVVLACYAQDVALWLVLWWCLSSKLGN